MGDLTAAQRDSALALLSTAFSKDGYEKVMATVRADEVLRANPGAPPAGPGGPGGSRPAGPGGPPPAGPGGPPPAGPGGPGRGPGRVQFGQDEYFLAFLGTPSTSTPWMLQFGGHHLAVNLTLAGNRGTLAPTLTGAQPAKYTLEGRTVRPLGDENDKAFALMAALDATQRSQAILPYAVSDLVLGPGQDGRTIQPEGLKVSSMSPAQQAMLLDIVREWAGIATDTLAAPRIEEIRAKLPQTYFAWSGPTTDGSLAYFRIQGPTLVIEYAPQRSLDHIHTIYRDPTNDYGSTYASK
jgi:hypothetical protein